MRAHTHRARRQRVPGSIPPLLNPSAPPPRAPTVSAGMWAQHPPRAGVRTSRRGGGAPGRMVPQAVTPRLVPACRSLHTPPDTRPARIHTLCWCVSATDQVGGGREARELRTRDESHARRYRRDFRHPLDIPPGGGRAPPLRGCGKSAPRGATAGHTCRSPTGGTWVSYICPRAGGQRCWEWGGEKASRFSGRPARPVGGPPPPAAPPPARGPPLPAPRCASLASNGNGACANRVCR